MRIKDKTIVITGGASGLGLATAAYMVKEKGARVAILDLNLEAGQQAVAELGAEHALFVQTDVSSEESVQAAVDAVMQRFGAIHICINGAAIASGFKLLGKEGRAAPLARFAQATAVNINGVFNVMSKCAEQMARNEAEVGEERGVVINVSSGAAYEGQVGQTAYAASKAAIIGMNMPAARELGAIGVRVNAIAPGLFLTAMVAGLDARVLDSLKEQMEAPRRLGDMREFAHCCAFIVENAYVNAETIRLDGAARLRAR
ncbi:SDR family NAD(P)-dependent oxidoreductase [Variovorax saccharolyticus]|uniref:SDR family NAD(P)-dependent oxidoreductase n=1 Tax=Variovorax saccharolyticus TaxID=3053516 RepID=UPI002578BAD6|nr:SDR family NAD(P)-dependent oxidoreductase [Variovorax sp. J31P216]MDM0028237.1 SDR family NAD(P)-dependent oxidoreductase [Variovorax sp. J31P216]